MRKTTLLVRERNVRIAGPFRVSVFTLRAVPLRSGGMRSNRRVIGTITVTAHGKMDRGVRIVIFFPRNAWR